MAVQKRTFKATRKLSGGQRTYRKWAEWDEGDVLVGKYMDSHTDQYKKVCPVVEVLDAQFKDKSGKNFEGKTLVLNANGMLNKAFEKLSFGDLFQVTYNGMTTMENGPFADKDAHVVEVQAVEEDDGQQEMDL